jgi:hypothetical protein
MVVPEIQFSRNAGYICAGMIPSYGFEGNNHHLLALLCRVANFSPETMGRFCSRMLRGHPRRHCRNHL